MNLEKLKKDTAHESVTVENMLGAKKSMSVYELLTNSSRSYWPCTPSSMSATLYLITEHVGELQPARRDDWHKLYKFFDSVKSNQPTDNTIPRSVVGNFVTILLLVQTQSEEMNVREANLLHDAIGDFIEAYMTALIRANHSIFINK